MSMSWQEFWIAVQEIIINLFNQFGVWIHSTDPFIANEKATEIYNICGIMLIDLGREIVDLIKDIAEIV